MDINDIYEKVKLVNTGIRIVIKVHKTIEYRRPSSYVIHAGIHVGGFAIILGNYCIPASKLLMYLCSRLIF